MNAIELCNLTKIFGTLKAVDEVSLTVCEGELFGLLGPNGAGKTTIINMLTTLLTPTSGTASVSGFDLFKNPGEIRRNIGIIFQDPSLDIQLTGRENLDFHSMMYGMKKEERNERIREVLDIVDLTDKADIVVGHYSGGMKRRLEIARGLVHHPKILFMDEPTLGLDAQTRRKIWEYIHNLNQKIGITVILTTHYMEEADFLCDRIAIIDHGKIIALDSSPALKGKLGGETIILEIPEDDMKHAVSFMNQVPGVHSVTAERNVLSVVIPDARRRIPEIFSRLISGDIRILSVSLKTPSLEDVYLSHTGSVIREQKWSPSEKNREHTLRKMRR